jgi:hypothetical protein
MALDQLGLTVTQDELARIMGTQAGYGTPFSRVQRLSKGQIAVEIIEWGGVEAIVEALANNKAVIVAILTNGGLPGWNEVQTQHTVLVVDITPDQIGYHDPALSEGPVFASQGEFLLAWSDMDELMATCWRASPTGAG